MLETFTTETFAGRVGETFRLRPPGGAPVDATLVSVTALGGAATGTGLAAPVAPERRTAFSLVFRTAPGAPLPQQIFDVEHAALGTVGIFLVPIGPDAEGMRYEAVFT